MKDSQLKTILMRRDGMDPIEAEDAIFEMRERVLEGEDPEDVLYEIGLEPDYIFDILEA